MPKPLPVLTDSSPICCAPLDSDAGVITHEDAVALARRLKALADPARIQLVGADHPAAP